MTSDREIFEAVEQAADYEKLGKLTGLGRAALIEFFNRTRTALWREEVKERGVIDGLNIFIDGASRGNPGPAAAGIVLKDAEGTILDAFGELLGETTNNVAEYSALVIALRRAAEFGAKHVDVCTDSELLQKQIAGEYRVKNAKLIPLYEEAKSLLDKFEKWSVEHVGRADNTYADSLANEALDKVSKKKKSGNR